MALGLLREHPGRSRDSRRAGGKEKASGTERAGRRSGRRPGDCHTSETILDAARLDFAELGYDRATIRGIAARAAVDPALVHHSFSSKERFFAAALTIPAEPGEVLRHALTVDAGSLGAAVVGAFLDAWEPVETRTPLPAMVRSAMANDIALGHVRECLERCIFVPLTEAVGLPETRLRATLVGAQLIGLAVVRYVARIEPLASASREELVAALGPTVQRYLTEDPGPADV